MAIRLEVMLDGRIEVMRSWVNDPMTRFLSLDSADESTYLRILAYLIRREIRRVKQERFVPMLDKECSHLLKTTLKEHANGQK